MNPNKTAIITLSILLSGCSAKVTMTGEASPPVEPLNVKILFEREPSCNFDEIAFISTPFMWDQNSAVNSAREKAAEIGADYINIKAVKVNPYNDAAVSAIAYTCGNVNRERIDVNVN